jgi:hypothetical protein
MTEVPPPHIPTTATRRPSLADVAARPWLAFD